MSRKAPARTGCSYTRPDPNPDDNGRHLPELARFALGIPDVETVQKGVALVQESVRVRPT